MNSAMLTIFSQILANLNEIECVLYSPHVATVNILG